MLLDSFGFSDSPVKYNPALHPRYKGKWIRKTAKKETSKKRKDKEHIDSIMAKFNLSLKGYINSNVPQYTTLSDDAVEKLASIVEVKSLAEKNSYRKNIAETLFPTNQIDLTNKVFEDSITSVMGEKNGRAFMEELQTQMRKQIEIDKKNADNNSYRKYRRGEKAAIYRGAMQNVLDNTPSGMLERIDDGVKYFTFYNNLKELTAASDWPHFGASDGTTGGTYTRKTGRVRLDGIESGFEGGIEGVYAHELTHDWPDKLTDYAMTSPVEGFAEFGRLVVTAKGRLANFPQCTKFWKENGLL
jgi:hypothetical protein